MEDASKLVMDESQWTDCDSDDTDFHLVSMQKRRRVAQSAFNPRSRRSTTSTTRRRRRRRRRKLADKSNVNLEKANGDGEARSEEQILLDELKNSGKIEASASKLGLNRIQVKTLIRRLVSSPLLLKIIMAKAGDIDLEENNDESLENIRRCIEPRMTRTRVKCAKEDGARVDWILDKLSKIGSESKLLTEEMPEDDDPADKEYEPSNEENVTTDDEYASDLDANVGSNASFELSSPLANTKCDLSPSVASISSGGKSQSPQKFKSPAVPPLQRVKSEHGVARSLNFDKEGPLARTRSKVNYKSVAIEELETNFEPPDVTPDMYITTDEHYAQFLRETFYHNQNEGEEQQETSMREIEEFDPDYFYQEAEELSDMKDREEFIYNRSARIPRKEADDILNEVIEVYDLHHSLDGKKGNARSPSSEKTGSKDNTQVEEGEYPSCGQYKTKRKGVETISDNQLEIIRHQFQQHVQLLTQSIIFSASKEQNKVNRKLRDMKSEIHLYLQSRQGMDQTNSAQPSILHQVTNLLPSSELIERYDNGAVSRVFKSRGVSSTHVARYDLSDEFLSFACASKNVFVYPSLLPSSGQTPDTKNVVWTSGEDQLLAMGLQAAKNDKLRGRVERMCESLSRNVIAAKSMNQIHKRIKNISRRLKEDTEHPVVFFNRNGKAPPVTKHFPDVILDADVSLNEADVGLNEHIYEALPQTFRDYLQRGEEKEPQKLKFDVKSKKKTQVFEAVFDIHGSEPTLRIIGAPNVTFELPQALLQAVESTEQSGGNSVNELKSNEGSKAQNQTTVPNPKKREFPQGQQAQNQPASNHLNKMRKIDQNDSKLSSQHQNPIQSTQNERTTQPFHRNSCGQENPLQVQIPSDSCQASNQSSAKPLEPQNHLQQQQHTIHETQINVIEKKSQLQQVHLCHQQPSEIFQLEQDYRQGPQLALPQQSSIQQRQQSLSNFEEPSQQTPTHDALGTEANMDQPQSIIVQSPKTQQCQPTQLETSAETLKNDLQTLNQENRLLQKDQSSKHLEEQQFRLPVVNKESKKDLQPPVKTNTFINLKPKTKDGNKGDTFSLQLDEADAEHLFAMAKKLLPKDKFDAFLNTLSNPQRKPHEVFEVLNKLCSPHIELQELLLDLLDSDSALHLGQEVYKAFNDRSEQKRFFVLLREKLEPQRHREVLEAIVQTMGGEKGPSLKELQEFGAKLFGDKPQLHKAFLQLLNQIDAHAMLAYHRPERMEWKDSSQESLSKRVTFHQVGKNPAKKFRHLPEKVRMSSEIERPRKNSNSKSCTDNCGCHNGDGSKQSQTLTFVPLQCTHCAINFINGKVFIRDGKNNLRPATVSFQSGSSPSVN